MDGKGLSKWVVRPEGDVQGLVVNAGGDLVGEKASTDGNAGFASRRSSYRGALIRGAASPRRCPPLGGDAPVGTGLSSVCYCSGLVLQYK